MSKASLSSGILLPAATPLPTHEAIATRRGLGGAFGALLLLAASTAGSGKAEEIDGELLLCCAEAERLGAQANALTDHLPLTLPLVTREPFKRAWDEADRLAGMAYDLRTRVVQLPARTPEGLQAKAKIVLTRLESDSLASEIALSLARDVLGRAAA